MERRLELHSLLCSILGSKHVYFQPPENVKMVYPCIVYSRTSKQETFADNSLYLGKMQYQVTVIDQDPDSEIPSKIANLPYTNFSRFFSMGNLNHDVYVMYF